VQSSTAQVSAIAHYDRARRTLCRFASRRSCRARPDPAAASPHGVEPHGLAEGPNPPLCSTACPPPTVAETALPTSPVTTGSPPWFFAPHGQNWS